MLVLRLQALKAEVYNTIISHMVIFVNTNRLQFVVIDTVIGVL
jgi:hypothetical protein